MIKWLFCRKCIKSISFDFIHQILNSYSTIDQICDAFSDNTPEIYIRLLVKESEKFNNVDFNKLLLKCISESKDLNSSWRWWFESEYYFWFDDSFKKTMFPEVEQIEQIKFKTEIPMNLELSDYNNNYVNKNFTKIVDFINVKGYNNFAEYIKNDIDMLTGTFVDAMSVNDFPSRIYNRRLLATNNDLVLPTIL